MHKKIYIQEDTLSKIVLVLKKRKRKKSMIRNPIVTLNVDLLEKLEILLRKSQRRTKENNLTSDTKLKAGAIKNTS